ncbi:alpha/beta-hydrolase [Corynespora cassiicola Philippines]|uniref:Alpha/beta-hydrolase n=1 Tax=Corynespora cassiicola Philippines TaxID=1448308 RepID=A0A2T2N558_CORCC|nr:alpha/beta-hydrolase [Corynespora cassiicola Philippines]
MATGTNTRAQRQVKEQRVNLVWLVLRLKMYQAYTMITAIFRDRETTRSYKHEVRNRTMRYILSTVPIYQMPEISPNTADQITKYCSDNGVPLQTEDVPGSSGAKIHWLHRNGADRVIFYCHGGAFSLPITKGHIKFVLSCREKLMSSCSNATIALLQYDLAPEAGFPTQYKQAVEAFNSVLSQGFKPENIILAGDSAGGHLSLALLSLIKHPLPQVPTPALDGPIGGLIAISPWTSFSSDSASFKECAQYDIVFAEQMHWWADSWISPDKRNSYCEMAKADHTWWTGLPIKRALVVAGGHELFRDDVRHLGEQLGKAVPHTTTVVCPKQIHVDCVFDSEADLEPGLMSKVIWEWLGDFQ